MPITDLGRRIQKAITIVQDYKHKIVLVHSDIMLMKALHDLNIAFEIGENEALYGFMQFLTLPIALEKMVKRKIGSTNRLNFPIPFPAPLSVKECLSILVEEIAFTLKNFAPKPQNPKVFVILHFFQTFTLHSVVDPITQANFMTALLELSKQYTLIMPDPRSKIGSTPARTQTRSPFSMPSGVTKTDDTTFYFRTATPLRQGERPTAFQPFMQKFVKHACVVEVEKNQIRKPVTEIFESKEKSHSTISQVPEKRLARYSDMLDYNLRTMLHFKTTLRDRKNLLLFTFLLCSILGIMMNSIGNYGQYFFDYFIINISSIIICVTLIVLSVICIRKCQENKKRNINILTIVSLVFLLLVSIVPIVIDPEMGYIGILVYLLILSHVYPIISLFEYQRNSDKRSKALGWTSAETINILEATKTTVKKTRGVGISIWKQPELVVLLYILIYINYSIDKKPMMVNLETFLSRNRKQLVFNRLFDKEFFHEEFLGRSKLIQKDSIELTIEYLKYILKEDAKPKTKQIYSLALEKATIILNDLTTDKKQFYGVRD